MPRQAKELGPLAVSRLPTGFHFVGGVPGLALQVLPSGGRSWVLRVMVGSKRRDMGLGGYPSVTLADARESARTARAKIKTGIDPIEEAKSARSMLKLAQANAVTFSTAATKYIEAHEATWKSAKHRQQWENSLSNHAEPVLGKLLVSEIKLPHILDVLEPIWSKKTETATRVRSRIESVLDWATTKGYREGLNPARWRGHLDNLLATPTKISVEEHFPALPFREAGAFIEALHSHHGIGAKALEFLILTSARSAEARGTLWTEIDLENKEWTIPAERMKMDRGHRVPLSDRAVKLLKAVPRAEGSPLVFTAPRGGELSAGTLNAIIKRMNETGIKQWVDPKTNRAAVAHGFRSTFRDWVSERTHYPREVAEMALAHSIGDKVEAAYRRGELFEKRRAMMSDWAAYLAKPEANAKVIPLQQGNQK